MTYKIFLHEQVAKKDFPRLSKAIQERIGHSIKTKLMTRPEVFGKPLSRSLRPYRKLRVGDYRIVFRIESKIVKIFIIAHRSIVYEKALKRLTKEI